MIPPKCGDALCCSAPIWDYRKDPHEKIISFSTVEETVVKGVKFNSAIIFYVEDKIGNPIRLALGCEHLIPFWDGYLYLKCRIYDSRPKRCRKHPIKGKLCLWDIALGERLTVYAWLSDRIGKSLPKKGLAEEAFMEIYQKLTIKTTESYQAFLLSGFPEYNKEK
ncbi:MAG: hypothetical protein ACFFBD_30315 [Candidatus Hodarchaeota archaeon]